MGANARRRIAGEFRWQQTTTKLAALYRRILEQEA